jgi:orotate phosphoribosyltransferase-like protein
MSKKVARSPWPARFPSVIAQTSYWTMKNNASYASAKRGASSESAISLVIDCIDDSAMISVKSVLAGKKARIVSVHAEELTGRNKIPMAYGEVLAGVLGLDTDPGIVQASVANHSHAPSIYHRFASPPVFEGYVEKNADYVIIDDTCTAGGTLANLRGFIEEHGGNVVLMSVLALNGVGRSYDISLSPGTLYQLRKKHPQLNEWWREEFGYGIDCLTEGEAGHLRAAPSFDTIRNRISEARRDLDVNGNESDSAGTAEPAEVVGGQAS